MRYKDLIDDPSFPHWGRSIIMETLRTSRDPVDTVNVLEIITEAAKDELRVLEFTPIQSNSDRVGEWLDQSIDAFKDAASTA